MYQRALRFNLPRKSNLVVTESKQRNLTWNGFTEQNRTVRKVVLWGPAGG